jgi:hypothetical protein
VLGTSSRVDALLKEATGEALENSITPNRDFRSQVGIDANALLKMPQASWTLVEIGREIHNENQAKSIFRRVVSSSRNFRGELS